MRPLRRPPLAPPRGRRHRRGQALAELALALPILIGVLTLTIEGSLLISAQQTLVDATHQAARAAAEGGEGDELIRKRIVALLVTSSGVDLEQLRVQVERGLDSNGADFVRLKTSVPVRPLGFTNYGSFQLESAATYRVPRQDDQRP